MQAKLNEGKLLNAFGNLSQFGYANSLIKDYDRRDVRISKLKVKESDFYYVGNTRFAICFRALDYSTMGYGMVSVIDYEKNDSISKVLKKYLPNGKMGLPRSSKTGDLLLNYNGLYLKISNHGIVRKITCKVDNFDGVADFECDLELKVNNQESIVVATPFKNKKHFRYSQTIPSMKVRGTARVGGRKYSFSEMDSFGILRWDRSVLPFNNVFTSAVMSSVHNGKNIAFNFMSNLGKNLDVTENMVFYDNKSYKIANVKFNVPVNEKGKEIIMDEWKITSSDDIVNLTFKPAVNQKCKCNLLVIKNTNNYIYGYFNGTLKLNDKEIKIENLLGFIDKANIRG